jgi:hypothetical protein
MKDKTCVSSKGMKMVSDFESGYALDCSRDMNRAQSHPASSHLRLYFLLKQLDKGMARRSILASMQNEVGQ